MTSNNEKKLLTKSDINKVFWRSFTVNASFNYERQMSQGAQYALSPILQKLYPDKKELGEALQRHAEFFNTTPMLCPFIFGITAAMEEENATQEDFDPNTINSVKAGLMGPLAGIGDSVFWGTLRPLAGGIACSLALTGNLFAPFLFLLLFNIPNVLVAIDITGKEGKNKLTDNSNFFCLGPSGSGKSFHMNSVVRQLHEQGTDVVMVDTGNSYEGLCEYLGGKYISYTEERPITMNPFRINREEYNIEKIDFLKNLILMIWKGSDSQIPEIEFRIVEQIIIDYYDAYFNGFTRYTDEQREVLLKNLFAAASRKNPNKPPREVDEMVRKQIEVLEARRAALKVSELNFNSFFDYSFDRLEQICTENDITTISYSTYSTMLQPFYKGGAYEKILNENVDSALFDETFIVFEVDAIKENKKLFPIVTLIIMDVFLQKMRIKKTRKVLVIEEAWKAIASPLMAEYIKFMYKTARKFWASVGVVTQEIQDIIGSEIVKEAIINNSDVVMLLDQSKFKERFDEIRKILGLTEVDCKKIFTINRLENKDGRSFFREVFIRRGTTSGVYGVEEPHECYMTYTTERAEKEALKLYKKELRCSHQEAIEAYCRDWDASGIGKALPFAQKVNETGRVLNLRPVHESK